MTKRTERKKRADSIRAKYKGLICFKIIQVVEQNLERGYTESAAFNEGLAQSNNIVNTLVTKTPHDAHLIRQSANLIERELEQILNTKNDQNRSK